MADLKYHFKDPSTHLRVNGQVYHQGNLTNEIYDYLVGWSTSYADLFAPGPPQRDPKKDELKAKAKEKEAAKSSKKLNDGNAKESTSEV